jgi:glycosyltransferase involved in cell wall biosynthesis
MPDVAVIIPTRGRSQLLGTTLHCALNQIGVDLEVIVVDDGSTDDTAALLKRHDDGRLRVLCNDTPQGVSAARNRGIAHARSRWVAFLDDDDLWAPDKLARQVQAAQAAGRDWSYTGSVNIADGFQIVHGLPPLPPEEVVAALPRYNAIPGGGSNVVVRREALLRAGPFDTRLRNTEDWEMWIRLARAGPPAWVCSPLLAYRVHASNSSLDIAEIVRGARLIEELHHTTADWGRLHRWLAESCLRTGQRRTALGQFARAAVHGQARGVASDLTLLARRRIRRGPSAPPAAGRGAPTWIEQAAGWLRELEQAG